MREEDIKKIKRGMTRQEMRELFGEPTDTMFLSQRQKRRKHLPLVYRYDHIELAFSGPKSEDGLYYAMDIGDGEDHNFLNI